MREVILEVSIYNSVYNEDTIGSTMGVRRKSIDMIRPITVLGVN